jgi:integrase/recombinase XerD
MGHTLRVAAPTYQVEDEESPVFLAVRGKTREQIDRITVWMMVKGQLEDAGIPTIYSNHYFRAAGITNFLENGGNLEAAQPIVGHADSRSSKLRKNSQPLAAAGNFLKILFESIRRLQAPAPASA